MKTFVDDEGREWTATANEEDTPRHHGRWYLAFEPADGEGPSLPMPEVRWKNAQTAGRTLRTMGESELRRRLGTVRRRAAARPGEPKP